MPERPKVGVGIAIFKEGKLLMHRRTGSHGSGQWSFLGGHMEHGEDPVATAQREAMEEGSIRLKNCRVIGFTNDIMPNDKHYITIFVAADWAQGDVVMSHEATEIGWFDPQALPTPLFPPVEKIRSGQLMPNPLSWPPR